MEVCRKHHKRVEGDGHLFTRCQCQNILLFFHWNNPTVDQVLGRFRLTTQIVHNEDTGHGFELQRRLVNLCHRIVIQLQLRKFQFAACDHHRPLAEQVPLVKTGRLAAQTGRVFFLEHRQTMHRIIIDRNHLAVDLDKAWHVDVRDNCIGYAVDQRCFTVSWSAIKKNGSAGVYRRPQFLRHQWIDDQFCKCFVQPLRRNPDVFNQLAIDLLFVLFHGDG